MLITVIRHSILSRGGDKLVFQYLGDLADKGHEVTYWVNHINTDFSIAPKIVIKKIPIPSVAGTIVFSLFRKFRAHVVLVDLVVMALFCSLRNRGRVVYLAQGYDLSYHKSVFLNSFIDFAYRWVLGVVPTVAVSEGLAARLKPYHPWNLTVIPNGVDLNLFSRNADSPYFLQRKKKFVVLFFARSDRSKGFDIAIQTFRNFSQEVSPGDWEIWVIGHERVTIDNVEAKNFGFLKDEQDLRDILSAADVFLVPSRSEGLSLLLLQALACQSAVVSTTASSILTHEVNGLVSPVDDVSALARNLKRVFVDSGLRERLKANARILAEQYSLTKNCTSFERVLQTFNGEQV